jgi:hypothetical protein
VHNRLQRLVDGRGLQESLDERRAEQLGVREDQCLLVGEVPEEGPSGDTRSVRDLDGGGVREPLLVEEFHRGLLQPVFAAVLPPRHGPTLLDAMTRRDNNAWPYRCHGETSVL